MCIKGYKARMEFQGLDFDGDRSAQYREVRKEMASIYSYDTNLFGPVEISSLSFEEASPEEMKEHLRERKNETKLVQRGHQRIMEKIKEVRQSFSKAILIGSRSGSGKLVYEFYDQLIDIWGGSPSTKPLSFGASTMDNPQPNPSTSSRPSCNEDKDNEKDEGDVEEPFSITHSSVPECLKRKAPCAADVVPHLIDNKRKFLEKKLSAAQRDKLLMEEAKQEMESRIAIADAMREASAKFNEAIDSISSSMNAMTSTIGKSIEILSHAMSSSCQPSNQNYFYQNHAFNPPYFKPNSQSNMSMGDNGNTYEDF